MQQGGGQMMRTVMVQQGSPYDQGGYGIPPAGTALQRTSDPYGIPPSQAGVCFVSFFASICFTGNIWEVDFGN